MREIKTAARAEPKTVEFMLDGVVLQARRPKDSVFADFFTVARSNDESGAYSVWPIVKEFFRHCLTEESLTHVNQRLNDPDDDLDIADMEKMFSFLLEEFSERPTE